MADAAASTAKSYILVGFIFYLLGAAGWIIVLTAFLAFTPFWIGQVSHMGLILFPGLFPLGVFGALTLGFTWWSWVAMEHVDQGRYEDARTASLVLGIFGIFLAFLVGGIFLLLAHGKLGEALHPAVAVRGPDQRFCVKCGRAVAADARFCSHCGAELPE